MLGPAIGAAIWLSLRDGLQQIPVVGDLWKFILGFAFVVLVTLFRKGVGGEIMSLAQRLRLQFFRAKPLPPPAPNPARFLRATSALQPLVPRSGKSAAIALEAYGVSKAYGGIHAVEDVSFVVPAGALYAVIGPNGAGKSTFLRLLAGEEHPDDGSIRVNGLNLTGKSVTEAAQNGIGKSFQINQLFVRLTVRQNLRIGALGRFRGRIRFDILRRAECIAPVEALIAALLDELSSERTGRSASGNSALRRKAAA